MSEASNQPPLSPERWEAIKDLFLLVIESPPSERMSLLERASGSDLHMADELKNTIPWRTGEEHGRLWRIRPRNWRPNRPCPKLSRARSAELVKHLSDPNGWWRDTAQRLLVERNDISVIPALEKLTRQRALGSRAAEPNSRSVPPRNSDRQPALSAFGSPGSSDPSRAASSCPCCSGRRRRP